MLHSVNACVGCIERYIMKIELLDIVALLLKISVLFPFISPIFPLLFILNHSSLNHFVYNKIDDHFNRFLLTVDVIYFPHIDKNINATIVVKLHSRLCCEKSN